MKRASALQTLAGAFLVLLSGAATPQAMPNRALALPRTSDMPAYAGTTGSLHNAANLPAGTVFSDFQCPASLAKEKELTALLKKKIELLELKIATKDPGK